ncbi:MAG: sensor domain-containing phosphodiesterase [Rhizobiaceae bacterium]
MNTFEQALLNGAAAEPGEDFTIQRALETVRKHLGMDVAYLSEFVGNDSVFRHVDAPGLEELIKAGDKRSLDEVYCRHILAGRLPELIPDTADEPLAAAMPITSAVPIGAHASIPIRLADGTAYGMFCCLSARPNASLNSRDLDVMRIFAELAAHQIRRDIADKIARESARARVREAMAAGAFSLVYQPICDMRSRTPKGFETLCRFASEPYRSPDKWFGEAASAGLGVDLEIAVLQRALVDLPSFASDIYVSFNASPETITSGILEQLLSAAPRERIVLEVTEHARVEDYGQLNAALDPLRKNGVRLAIDDAGAGFSSLQHIIQLAPDIIKLDMALTRDIDTDPAKRALASALIHFARETGAEIVAEGIETETEYDTLRALNVGGGQGYFLARPSSLLDIQRARRARLAG